MISDDPNAVSLKEHLLALIAERDKAIVSALVAIDRRLANTNEWREALNDIVKKQQGSGMELRWMLGWLVAAASLAFALFRPR